MGHTRQVDDTSFVAGLDLVHEKLGEQEMAEMVHTNLHFESLLGLFPLG